MIADFILRHAHRVLTCAGPAPRIGVEMAQVPSIDDGALPAREGRHGPRTEEAYVGWIRRFIVFHGKRHPREMGERDVTRPLTSAAADREVSASTQNQALSAILFLYEEVLGRRLARINDIVRAQRPVRLPVVLSRDEVWRYGSMSGPLQPTNGAVQIERIGDDDDRRSRLSGMSLGGQAVNGSRSDDVIDLPEGHMKVQRLAWALTAINLALLVIVAGHAWPATAQTVGPEAVVDGFVRAWNAHDMKAFGRLFTEDADWVNVAGIRVKGRTDIQAEHEEAHATYFKTTILASTGTEVRLVRPEVAVLHVTWELNGQLDPKGEPRGTRRGIITIVAVKQEDGWRISAGQNTNALPPG